MLMLKETLNRAAQLMAAHATTRLVVCRLVEILSTLDMTAARGRR